MTLIEFNTRDLLDLITLFTYNLSVITFELKNIVNRDVNKRLSWSSVIRQP